MPLCWHLLHFWKWMGVSRSGAFCSLMQHSVGAWAWTSALIFQGTGLALHQGQTPLQFSSLLSQQLLRCFFVRISFSACFSTYISFFAICWESCGRAGKRSVSFSLSSVGEIWVWLYFFRTSRKGGRHWRMWLWGHLCKTNYSMTPCYHSMATEIGFKC